MGKFDGYLILCDMDGTLLNDECVVSEENARAIAHFQSEGGMFGLASGRHPKSIRNYFDMFTPNAPCICYNGGLIYDFSKECPLFLHALPKSALNVANKIDSLFPTGCIAVETLESMYLTKDNEVSRMLVEIVGCKAKYVEKYEDVTEPWIKLSAWTQKSQTLEMEKTITEMNLPDGIHALRTHACAVEILSRETDKGFALNELKSSSVLDHGIKKIIALGDNENDNIMLQKADYSMVPSNANPLTVKFCKEQLNVSCSQNFVKAAVERLETLVSGGLL